MPIIAKAKAKAKLLAAPEEVSKESRNWWSTVADGGVSLTDCLCKTFRPLAQNRITISVRNVFYFFFFSFFVLFGFVLFFFVFCLSLSRFSVFFQFVFGISAMQWRLFFFLPFPLFTRHGFSLWIVSVNQFPTTLSESYSTALLPFIE